MEEKAQALVDEVRTQVDAALAAVEGQESVRVAVIQPSGEKIMNRGADSLAGDMVRSLGGELAKPDGSDISKEDLVACDPDVIFVIYMPRPGEGEETVKQAQLSVITEDPALASLSAVQSGRVYPVMLGDVYASGPRTIDGVRALAQGMYPGLEL